MVMGGLISVSENCRENSVDGEKLIMICHPRGIENTEEYNCDLL